MYFLLKIGDFPASHVSFQGVSILGCPWTSSNETPTDPTPSRPPFGPLIDFREARSFRDSTKTGRWHAFNALKGFIIRKFWKNFLSNKKKHTQKTKTHHLAIFLRLGWCNIFFLRMEASFFRVLGNSCWIDGPLAFNGRIDSDGRTVHDATGALPQMGLLELPKTGSCVFFFLPPSFGPQNHEKWRF